MYVCLLLYFTDHRYKLDAEEKQACSPSSAEYEYITPCGAVAKPEAQIKESAEHIYETVD